MPTCEKHVDYWTGLHGPVSFLGDYLYVDDPEILLDYYKMMCSKITQEEFQTVWGHLTQNGNGVLHQGNANVLRRDLSFSDDPKAKFVFVVLGDELVGWQLEKGISPTHEQLHGMKGQQLARRWFTAYKGRVVNPIHKIRCKECKSLNVQSAEWIYPNTEFASDDGTHWVQLADGEPLSPMNSDNWNYCDDCQKEVELEQVPEERRGRESNPQVG